MNKNNIAVVFVIVLLLGGLVYLFTKGNLFENKAIKIITPADGAELEIGDNYTVTWVGDYDESAITLVEKTYTSENEFSYGFIAKDIPFSAKSFTWKVPLMDKQYNYKIVMWTENRTEIAESDGYFKIVDKNPNIAGSEYIKINLSNVFNFGVPFSINGVAGHESENQTADFIYSSNQDIQSGLVTARIVSLYPDACEEGAFYPQDAINAKCIVNEGEQGVRIFVRAVIENQGLFYVIGRSIYLSSETMKKFEFGDAEYQYEIELLSLDVQKEKAKIVIRRL